MPPDGKDGDLAVPAVRWIEVGDEEAGQRIDNYLIARLKGVPKSRIYRILRSGEVRVNSKRVAASDRVQGGDRIRIPPLRMAERDEAVPAPHFKMPILFEDDWLIAIDKPAGLAVHGGSGIAHGVIESLRSMRPQARFLELVHRLDRDTSGLLLVARKRSALTELQALMREDGGRAGGIRKRYLALLTGRMPDGVMSVDAPLHVGLRQGGERHVQVNPSGKRSLSHFKVLERRGGQSYCEVRIETGRTHQIRVHAQHIGHPVAGDDKYGDEAANRRLREQVGLKRMFLHASTLEFALDGGASPYLLNAPLAPELVDALDRLR